MKGISKIPILGNIIQTQKILDRMEDTMDKTGSKWKTFGTGIKATGSEIFRIFTSPIVLGGILVGIISKIIEGVFELDKNITNTANSLAISKDSAQGLYKNFEKISLYSKNYTENLDNAFLSISNQGKALNDLNSSFQSSVLFTNSMVQNQILLTKQMGIQSEEAGAIQRLSMLNGQSAESTLKTIVKQNTSLISYRKVIADVAKLNGQLVAQYKNSPEMLAKAVVEAGKLGISLDQAKKAADGLLNFQSSIESELEAELLTGRSLNLEKARALALDGKSAEAAKEMLRQVGSFSQFSGLNVIQQQSIAKSVGMTADELSNALREQETLTALGKQNKQALQEQYDLYKRTNDVAGLTRLQEEMRSKENGDILLKNIAQASLQQRFEESMEKIKEIFVSIVSGPLMGMLNGIAKFLSNTTAVKAALIGISAVIGALVASLITAAFTVNPIGAGIGLIAGLAAGGTVAAMATNVQDSLITPDGGIQISTPRGMIVPDKNDSIITTTDPSGLLSGNGGNSKGVEEKLEKMIGLLQKGGNVYMDSNRVGTTQGMSYTSYA